MNEAPDVRLAGGTLEQKRHVCAFFNNRDQEYNVMLPFLTEGMDRGERAVNILDGNWESEHLRRLGEAGVDTGAAFEKGLLQIHPWEDAHLRPGHFDQHAMLGWLDEQLGHRQTDGFSLTRLWANMEWGLLNRPGVDDLVEYEARVNDLLGKYDDAVVCVYDLSRFSAGVIVDVLRTHPLVIIGGMLHENPFYVPPDELLRELRKPN